MSLVIDPSAFKSASDVVKAANAAINAAVAQGKAVGADEMLSLAVALASANIARQGGGPFGAVVADMSGPAPRVVGVGANHVTTQHDPSAHAEVEAIRDAATRLGASDMSGLQLFSSCECCPMCLAVANGSGIASITYAATREQAAQAGFSDALQYCLCQLDDSAIGTYISSDARDALLQKLDGHGAAVLNVAGDVIAYGDSNTEHDPSALASVQAVRAALKQSGGIWLPEGCTLLSFQKPHLAGIMVADWVRLLRPRDGLRDDAPEHDSRTPNPLHICYLNDAPEEIIVRDASGQAAIVQDAELTRQQPALSEAERAIPTHRTASHALQQQAQAIFEEWSRGVESGQFVRY